MTNWSGRLPAEHRSTAERVFVAECTCGWSRLFTAEAEAQAAATTHERVHRVMATVQAVTAPRVKP